VTSITSGRLARILVTLSVLGGVLLFGGPSDARSCDTSIRRDVAYGPAARQRLDVYPAAACDAPVLVWVHGGGWVTGDKGRLNAKRAWARANGWTLVSVDYRLTDVRDPPSRRLRYPSHDRDVGRALNWVEDHLGTGPIAVAGHSAGAQIVSSIGTDAYTRADRCGVVSLDTEGYDVTARIRAGDRGARLYRAVFGNRPAVWADASPINHVDGADPPEVIVRRGTLHRQRGQAAFAQALRGEGVPVTVVRTPTYTHSDVNRLLGDKTDDVLTPAVEAFLADCFAA
jgi:acetyl esterase/lipase